MRHSEFKITILHPVNGIGYGIGPKSKQFNIAAGTQISLPFFPESLTVVRRANLVEEGEALGITRPTALKNVDPFRIELDTFLEEEADGEPLIDTLGKLHILMVPIGVPSPNIPDIPKSLPSLLVKWGDEVHSMVLQSIETRQLVHHDDGRVRAARLKMSFLEIPAGTQVTGGGSTGGGNGSGNTDEHGCPDGFEWNATLERCVPTDPTFIDE